MTIKSSKKQKSVTAEIMNHAVASIHVKENDPVEITVDSIEQEPVTEKDHAEIVDKIYSLRSNFLVIGLTGRTGSGCTTVADMLTEKNFNNLKSNYNEFHAGPITNQDRKDRIVYNFLKENWTPFVKITVSDYIYFFAFSFRFDDFKQAIVKTLTKLRKKMTDSNGKKGDAKGDNENVQPDADPEKAVREEEKYKDLVSQLLDPLKDDYDRISDKINELNQYLSHKLYRNEDDVEKLDDSIRFLLVDIPQFRETIEKKLAGSDLGKGIIPRILQEWGNNIRDCRNIIHTGEAENSSPDALASTVNNIIKLVRRKNHLLREKDKSAEGANEKYHTRIVIDALRNPFEILYFRERYSAFYCMSVNTPVTVRHDKLYRDKKLSYDEIEAIDDRENGKSDTYNSFVGINLESCIQLSDIFLSHDGTPAERNSDLVNQLFTYLSLMLHPGIVPPSSQERLMQIAFTAKLNSGCLSRQVGAAITDENYSVKAVGWNSSPAGTVPCSLRRLDDLLKREDPDAYSKREMEHPKFRNHLGKIKFALDSNQIKQDNMLNGIGFPFCFKDIHTGIETKQKNNQVHTRSLHAEENAFLQLSKYGGQGIEGGKLFTTASCCELCAKKAYQLGIKEIIYIDSYPGISEDHVLSIGPWDRRPKLILFSGAVGRAYISLYNPFMPLKDELRALSGVSPADPLNERGETKTKTSIK